MSPAALAKDATGRYSAQQSLRNRAIPARARIPLGSLIPCRPLSGPRRWRHPACELARIPNNATQSYHVGAGSLVQPSTSALGGHLQPVGLLAGLVAERRTHLPSLLCSPPSTADPPYVGHGNVGRFLVGLPTQRVPARVRWTSSRLSFPPGSAVGRSVSAHLSPETPSPADDSYALANGFVCCSANSQAVTQIVSDV